LSGGWPGGPPADAATSVPAQPAAPTATGPSTDLAASASVSGGLGTQPNGVGSWFQLTWAQPVTAGRVVVSNPAGGLAVTGVLVTFSDGSTATVPVQGTDGKTLALSFPARATSTLRITVTSATGPLTNPEKTVLSVYSV
jgi:hypothetical protein